MVLTRFFGKKPDPTGTVVTVRLNDRAQPMDRGERYEDPLQRCSPRIILSEPELSLGSSEGLGIYLNGTDLPDETYRDCDVDVVYSEFNRLLTGIGSVHSHWQGPTETALYVYGRTAAEMRTALQPFLDSYPLCERARIVQIAPASEGEGHLS